MKPLAAKVVKLDFIGQIFCDQVSDVIRNPRLEQVPVRLRVKFPGLEDLRGTGKKFWDEMFENLQRFVPVFENSDDGESLVDILNRTKYFFSDKRPSLFGASF